MIREKERKKKRKKNRWAAGKRKMKSHVRRWANGLFTAVDVQVVSVASTNNTLKFFPEKITAAVGSMVQFQFRGGNHTVTQSTFDQPCVPINQVNSSIVGIFSGYQPVAASASMGMVPVFTVMINNTNPVWLYCSQGRHCQNGMVMVINEP
jgi:plastocyanin